MSLQVWLPLNGDLKNYGLTNVSTTLSGSFVDTGKIGKAFSSTSDSHHISLNSYMSICKNYINYSMCAWIYMTSQASNHSSSILSTGNWNGGSSQLCFAFYNYSNGYRKLLVPNKNSWIDGIDLSTPIKLNTWYHVAITYDGSITKGYINGNYVGSYEGGGITTTSENNNLFIGAATYTSGFTLKGKINDIRIYDHCLSTKEIKEISKGLVLHYKFQGRKGPNDNIGGTSADYSNMIEGQSYNLSGWGGDSGTVQFYHSGGYNGLPYKVYHKTATGSGGVYYKTANDIILENNTTYTMTIWIKSSIAFSGSSYNFNINRQSDNHYITYGSGLSITTSWKKFVKTFTTTSSEAGYYGEMGIIYNDSTTNYDIFFSGFKIEKGSISTDWTPPVKSTDLIEYDCSGYRYNGTYTSFVGTTSNSPRYQGSTSFVTNKCFTSYIPNGNNVLTYSSWIKLNSYHSERSCICIGTTYFTIDASGHLSGYAYGKSSPGYHSSSGIIPLNTWTHIALVWNETHLIGYINGNQDFQIATTGTFSTTHSSTSIGREGDSGRQLNGYLSDLRIYATALSAEDIKELYDTSMVVDNNGNIHARELVEL